MNLAKLALENSRITASGILLIVLVGVSSFLSVPSAEDPTITIREVTVTASYPGMSPDRVEELIAKPLEAKMRQIAEIEDIRSTSKPGTVELDLSIHDWVANLGPVHQNIRNKANDAKAELPEGTLGPVVNDEKGLTSVASLALWSDVFSMDEMRYVARVVLDILYTLVGVS